MAPGRLQVSGWGQDVVALSPLLPWTATAFADLVAGGAEDSVEPGMVLPRFLGFSSSGDPPP